MRLREGSVASESGPREATSAEAYPTALVGVLCDQSMSRSPHEEAPGEEQKACTEEHGEGIPRRRRRERVFTVHPVPEFPATFLDQCTRREAMRGISDVIRAEDDRLPRAQLRVSVVSVLERRRALDDRSFRHSE